MKLFSTLILAVLLTASCASSFRGLKVRVQSPSMSEAFRKLSLALRADDYEVETLDSEAFQVVTQWREMKKEEENEAEKKSGDPMLVRIALRLEPRGTLYDVFLTPFVQSGRNDEMIPESGHPLFQKWQRILNKILVREQREED